jgi:hypothetical protein
MDLLPYRVIDCPVQSIISTKVIEFLKNHSNFFEDRSFHLWNKMNTLDLIKAVPEIPKFFQTLNLQVAELSITVVNQHKDVTLHIDELPVTAKINFPILNTKNTINEWYHVPEHLLKTVTPVVNQFGALFYDLASINLDECEKIAEYELHQPVVFNSQIPHRIKITPEANLPRLVMPCTFFNQPIDLLAK